MLQRTFDLVFAIAILGGSIILWLIADGFPKSPKYSQVDTDYWPKIVFGLLILFSAGLVIQKLLSLRSRADDAPAEKTAPDHGYFLRFGIIGALVVAYFLALQWVGFVIATVLFLWAASFVIPYRNLTAKLVFAPAFTACLTLFFSYGLSLPLPRGSGVFYDLSQKLF